MEVMFTTEEQQQTRLELCRKCPKYRKQARYLFGLVKLDKEQCAKCLCLIEPKTVWAASECPLKTWSRLPTTN